MNHRSSQHRDDLRAIARRAMIDRGLLPDFSAAAWQSTWTARGEILNLETV